MFVSVLWRLLLLCALFAQSCAVSCSTETVDMQREVAARLLFAEGDKLRESTDPGGALAIFQRVIKDYPGTDSADFAHFRCAEALIQLGKCGEALTLAQSVIDKNPKTIVAAWCQYAIGQALLKNGDEYGGIAALRKIKQTLPDHLDLGPLRESRQILGALCERRLGSRMDLLDLAEYLGVDKSNTTERAELYAIVGAYKGRDGHIELASPVLEKLAAECPKETDELEWARSEVAMSYLDSPTAGGGNFAKLATEMLAPLLKPDATPNDQAGKACLCLARYYMRGKMDEKALQTLREGSETLLGTVRGPEILYELGRALTRAGKIEEASAVMKRLVTDKPLSAQAMIIRAVTEEEVLGSSTASIESLIKSTADNWRPEWSVVTLYPMDGSLGNPVLIARQAVALAREDRPDVAVELINSFAKRTGLSANDAAKAGLEVVTLAMLRAVDENRFSREAAYAFQMVRDNADKESMNLFLSRVDKQLALLAGAERAVARIWLQSQLQKGGRYEDAEYILVELLRMSDITRDTAANARYDLGICYRNLGNNNLAHHYLQQVVDEYNDTGWASRATRTLIEWSSADKKNVVN